MPYIEFSTPNQADSQKAAIRNWLSTSVGQPYVEKKDIKLLVKYLTGDLVANEIIEVELIGKSY